MTSERSMDYFVVPYFFSKPTLQKRKKKILENLRQFFCICLALCYDDSFSSVIITL